MNWLLLRGLVRQVGHWGSFPEDLKKIPGVENVICLDLPGVGTETGRMFVPMMSDVVQDVRNRLLKSEVDFKQQQWSILGHSLGSMVAMQWAHDYPHDFKKLVVMNASSRDVSVLKRIKPLSALSVIKIFLEKDLRTREKLIIGMVSNLKKEDKKVLEEWVNVEKKNPILKRTAVEQLLAASLFKSPDRIRVPMLALTSRGDRMVDYHCTEFLAKKFKAKLAIHPNAGHDIPIDDTPWILEQIRTF